MKFTKDIFYPAIGSNIELAELATNAAQAAFDKWLSEQQVVYGDKLQDVFTTYKEERDTHKARLVCIEELAPNVCAHDSVSRRYTNNIFSGWECDMCNKMLKPNWSEA